MKSFIGALFNVKAGYIYKAALQLELLMIRDEMMKIQTMRVAELREKLDTLKRKRRR